MINFKDIPTQKEPSYVFVSTPSLAQLRWQLDRNGIEYTVSHRPQADKLPKGIEFPETVPFLYELDREYERPTSRNKISCIISHMDKEAFIQRIREMNGAFDPEYWNQEEKRWEAHSKSNEHKSHMRESGQGE